jgi:spore germination protein YaaH
MSEAPDFLSKLAHFFPNFLLNKKLKKIFGFGFLFLGICIASAGSVLYFFQDTPLLSPITSHTTFQFLPWTDNMRRNAGNGSSNSSGKKLIYGFLPYWNLQKATIQPELDRLAYFGLSFDANGNIVTRQDNNPEQGYHKMQSEDLLTLSSQLNKRHGKTEIVLTQFNNDETAAFLLSDTAQQHLITSLDAILQAYPFEGVNVDIEYLGNVTPNLRAGYVHFISLLKTDLLQKHHGMALSIDVFASAGNDEYIWDLRQLSPLVDDVIVMAYDFHQRSSIQAGPIAPLFGGKKLWDSDITQHLQELIALVPKEKILLGVPFYGYEWQTTSRNPQAQTLPNTGATASVDRVSDILMQKKELAVQEGWNEDALSPYLSYKKNGKIFMIYYENSRSLSYKLDLVNQLDLGGIAIWALGYEGNSRELWDVIAKKI